MKAVYYLTYAMAFVFLVGETARQGLGYFSVNATTMIEDYLCGALMLWAAWVWSKGYDSAAKIMAVAWAYATGGMFFRSPLISRPGCETRHFVRIIRIRMSDRLF